jgi:predicted CoA-binding protein
MKQTIQHFIEDKNLALIGVSTNSQKFGNILLKELQKKGYTIYPVHPNLNAVEGISCFASVNELPKQVQNLIIAVQSQVTEEIVKNLDPSRIKRVWMHRGAGKGSSSPQAIQECKNKGIEVVYGFCPMMFLVNTGVHTFHLWIRKSFSKLPVEYKAG